MNTVVQILDTIAEEAARAEYTDGQLLDRFVRSRDEHAFATVVRRHGPMVLGVCRRVLGNPTDAEDAFQAAFLVLARRATVIDTQRPLAQWLYGVAYNTARKLRQANTRRAAHISPLAEAPEPHAPLPAEHNELLAVLDDELSRLPERYRALIVLCDLEGHTRTGSRAPKERSRGAWPAHARCSPPDSRLVWARPPQRCSWPRSRTARQVQHPP